MTDLDPPAPTRAGARKRLPHVGALDGLRALCLIAVMLYHGTFSWAPGGFLGVSTFFTLSGFLITALLIVEVRRDGGVSLGRFWAARARRLLPAAALTFLLVVAFARFGASPTQLAGLRQDLWASFGLSINWRLALSGRAYGGYAASASPVQHLWSLAVEEQFYLLLPLLVGGAVLLARRLGRPLRQVVGGGAAVLALMSTAALALSAGPEGDVTWAYYATHTRAAELLAGVVLACTVHRLVGWHHRRRVMPSVGVAGAVVLVGSWVLVDQGDQAFYRGGLTLYTLGSAAMITACLYSGPVRTVLQAPPLQWIGRVSYGAYLYHWPIFSWLDRETVGVGGYLLFAVQVATTLGVAWASATFVEMPIRRRQLLPRVPAPALLGAVAVALLVTVLVPWRTTDTGPSGVEVATGQRIGAAEGEGRALVQVSAPDPAEPAKPQVRRLLLVGDSIAQQLAPYVAEALPGVDVRWIGAAGIGPLTDQAAIARDLRTAIGDVDPDMVLFHFAGSYLHRAPDAGPYVTDDGTTVEDGSELMFTVWQQEVARLVAIARTRGAEVLWGLVPPIEPTNFFGYLADTVERFNAGYRSLTDVTRLDWNSLTGAPDGGFELELTDPTGETEVGRAEDGLHFTAFGNRLLAATVADEVEDWSGRQRPGGGPPA